MKYYLALDSPLHSAPYSQPYLKIQKTIVVVPSLTTTDHAIIFTQHALHRSFISKKKKNALSIIQVLETSTFYHIFISFLFQTNTDLLLIHQNSNDFTQETLYLSFISKKKWCCPSQRFFKTSTLYHIFTIFNSE